MLVYERLVFVSIGLAVCLLVFAGIELAVIRHCIYYVIPTWMYGLTTILHVLSLSCFLMGFIYDKEGRLNLVSTTTSTFAFGLNLISYGLRLYVLVIIMDYRPASYIV